MRVRKLAVITAALSAVAVVPSGIALANSPRSSTAPARPPAYRCRAHVPTVTKLGDQFAIDGKPTSFRGFTLYPIGITWNSRKFPGYVTSILDLGQRAGQTLVRPTDEWTKDGTRQRWNDRAIWRNLDDVVCQAAARGMHVVMDLSAFKWLLESHGRNPMNAQAWLPFLRAVGAHYRGVGAIATYYLDGEPAFPRDRHQAYVLKVFYRTLTDAMYADDPTHLISGGGFINMNNGYPQWWKAIYALPHNDVAGFKTYSQPDLADEAGYIRAIHSLNRIALDAEFGEPQYVGDRVYSGHSYHGLRMSRATFYTDVYTTAIANHAGGEVFWNLARLVGPQHFDVSRRTPGVWRVVRRFGRK